MKQYPKRTKFKKCHKPSGTFLNVPEQKKAYPIKGQYALVSKAPGRLTYRQLEAGRRSIPRNLRKGKQNKKKNKKNKKASFIIIRPFPYVSLTKKPLASRMGKGKGTHYLWVAPIRSGQVLYEIGGVKSTPAILALNKASRKMPFTSKIIPLSY